MNRFVALAICGYLLSAVSSDYAKAGWDCPSGQPQACINDVNANNSIFQNNINYYNGQLDGSKLKIKNCWDKQKQAIANKNTVNREISKNEGRIEEIVASEAFLEQIYNSQKNQISMLKLYQNEFQSYFREVIMALKNDISGGSISELLSLQVALNTQLSLSKDEAEINVLKLTSSILNEVIGAINSNAKNNDTLTKRLQDSLIASGGSGETNSKNLSILTKLLIESTLTEQDIAKLDINQQFSIILIQAASILDSIQNKIKELIITENAVNDILSSLYFTYENQHILETQLNAECSMIENSLTVIIPSRLASDQAALANNIEYLRIQGCRRDKCSYEAPERPHPDKQ